MKKYYLIFLLSSKKEIIVCFDFSNFSLTIFASRHFLISLSKLSILVSSLAGIELSINLLISINVSGYEIGASAGGSSQSESERAPKKIL